jgi:hypothetical protein
MTTKTASTPARIAQVSTRSIASAAAEDYFNAEKLVKASDERIKPVKDAMAAAIKQLATTYPVQRDHASALHPITIYGNDTATFLHREDDSTGWQKIALAMLPFLTPEQTAMFETLKAAHTGTRTTKTLKR